MAAERMRVAQKETDTGGLRGRRKLRHQPASVNRLSVVLGRTSSTNQSDTYKSLWSLKESSLRIRAQVTISTFTTGNPNI